jgi:hypothetical protein
LARAAVEPVALTAIPQHGRTIAEGRCTQVTMASRATPGLAVVIAGTLLAGCPDGPQNPCLTDIAHCRDDVEELPVDPQCTIAGPIEVELGWGEQELHPFSEPVEVHYGLQGGSHIFHAVRIRGAEADDVPMVRVELHNYDAVEHSTCLLAITNLRTTNPGDLPPALREGDFDAGPVTPVVVLNGDDDPRLAPTGPSRCLMAGDRRTLLLGRDQPLPLRPDGSIEAYGILLQLGYGSLPEVALSVEVTDACGRTGFASYSVPITR